MVEEMRPCLGRQLLVMGRNRGHMTIQLHYADGAVHSLNTLKSFEASQGIVE